MVSPDYSGLMSQLASKLCFDWRSNLKVFILALKKTDLMKWWWWLNGEHSNENFMEKTWKHNYISYQKEGCDLISTWQCINSTANKQLNGRR